MTDDDIRDVFAPVLPVSLKRMFGGHGVYSEGRIFALEVEGVLYLKTDGENRPFFEKLGSGPFVYAKKTGEQAVMSYFSLPDDAYEDVDLLRDCVREALGAARRAEAKSAAKLKKPRAKAR